MKYKKHLQVVSCVQPLQHHFAPGAIAEYDFTGNGIPGSEGKACNIRVSPHEVWSIEERNEYEPWNRIDPEITHAIIAHTVLVTFKEIK